MAPTDLLRKPDGFGLAVLLDCINLADLHAAGEVLPRPSRFIELAALKGGDRIKWEGAVRTVIGVQLIKHAKRVRVTFVGGDTALVPFGARLTRFVEVR